MSAEGPGEPQDPIGSAAEEAAKLLGALSGWAKDHGTGVSEHLATGAAECTYCPICRTVHVVREISPEVREHLATAAASLMQAFAGLVTAAASHATPPSTRGPGVEKINLDTTEWPES
ncbi:DUF5304 family protein [Nocardioides sp. Kera G14]|uniref:DUF5304 family protein n=1 Tax=Nocardioides sp. Kera G14 TaxID=2884264 RepID=UPI001D11725B|nr:DUF5304 family protein [Nocardioides sp. Kera G14]UDY22519.1 DUF5304 domain-containing protein [Nocardioides sp. Kera G14]